MDNQRKMFRAAGVLRRASHSNLTPTWRIWCLTTRRKTSMPSESAPVQYIEKLARQKRLPRAPIHLQRPKFLLRHLNLLSRTTIDRKLLGTVSTSCSHPSSMLTPLQVVAESYWYRQPRFTRTQTFCAKTGFSEKATPRQVVQECGTSSPNLCSTCTREFAAHQGRAWSLLQQCIGQPRHSADPCQALC